MRAQRLQVSWHTIVLLVRKLMMEWANTNYSIKLVNPFSFKNSVRVQTTLQSNTTSTTPRLCDPHLESILAWTLCTLSPNYQGQFHLGSANFKHDQTYSKQTTFLAICQLQFVWAVKIDWIFWRKTIMLFEGKNSLQKSKLQPKMFLKQMLLIWAANIRLSVQLTSKTMNHHELSIIDSSSTDMKAAWNICRGIFTFPACVYHYRGVASTLCHCQSGGISWFLAW